MSTIPWKELEEAALEAQSRAYAPYSNYFVGAALLLESGEIIRGSNVENASYGLTLCAERSAISQMISLGKSDPIAIVVATFGTEPGAPCGMCRQVLFEFANELTVRLISKSNLQNKKDLLLSELLPFAFGPKNLSK